MAQDTTLLIRLWSAIATMDFMPLTTTYWGKMVACWLISVITSTSHICAIIGNTTGSILKNRKGGLIAHLLEIRSPISIIDKDRLPVVPLGNDTVHHTGILNVQQPGHEEQLARFVHLFKPDPIPSRMIKPIITN